MKKIAVVFAVLLCAFSFAQDEKGTFAVIGDVSIEVTPDTAVLTIPVTEGNNLLKDPKITVDKSQLVIDLMPASPAVEVLEKQVAGSVVQSFSVSQSQPMPPRITRIILKTSDKCDFIKEVGATKIVITLARSPEVKPADVKQEKAVSLEDTTKKLGEQVVSSEEADKTDQFALQKGTMKKGDLEQIVPFLTLSNTDLTTFLKTIVDEAGFNLVTSKSVSGTIPTIQLKNVSFKKILDLILKQNGFTYQVEGNIIRVATPAEMKAEEEGAIMETRYFTISFAKAAEVMAAITPFLSGAGKAQSDTRTNTLIITDITSKMDTFANLITSLDTRTAQVNIEAKFIDFKGDSQDQLGIRWDVETGSTIGKGSGLMSDIYPGTANTTQLKGSLAPPTTSVAKAGQFQYGVAGTNSFWASIDALITTNDANLLAKPSITTVNNKAASINITQAYSYISGFNAQTGITTYASIDAGVNLQVTPQINSSDYVTLIVVPTVSSIVSAGPPPIVDTRTASTQVLVKDGETFVIGGLNREDDVTTVNKIPILGDIPLIGMLFQNKTVAKAKRDLAVFITPHIIR